MSELTQIDQITERVERLLVRYEELTRTNTLLYMAASQNGNNPRGLS